MEVKWTEQSLKSNIVSRTQIMTGEDQLEGVEVDETRDSSDEVLKITLIDLDTVARAAVPRTLQDQVARLVFPAPRVVLVTGGVAIVDLYLGLGLDVD